MLLAESENVPIAKELPIDFEALMSNDTSKPQNKRLGKYVEQLLGDYLKQHREVSHFQHNLVISEKKKTIGEIDLVFDHRGQRFHWEIAFKFYLLHQHQDLTAYFGPQGHDRLDLKVGKLLSQQLPLINHEQLNGLRNTPNGIISQLYVKGWIFYHRTHPVAGPEFPKLNPDHSKGWWLYEPELIPDLFPQDTHFQIVPKQLWLSSVEVFKRFSHTMDFETLIQQVRTHFQNHQRALMIYTWNPHNSSSSRGMIVPPTWPELA